MKALFPSLPTPPDLAAVFTKFPRGARPILALHDIVLREESDLTAADRELIAAHVSGINACNYCFDSHATIARAFGIDSELIESMQTDLSGADVSEELKPILAYVEKLTTAPSRITSSDAQAVYDAGWSEQALYDAILVCSLFNFMNRLVEGTGCLPGSKTTVDGNLDKPLASYEEWGRDIGFID